MTRTTVDTRLANEAWEGVLTAHNRLMRTFASREYWAKASIREYDVLYTLTKCGSPQRLSDVSDHVLLSQPALSRLVDRLVERGLIERCVDPADARAVRLSLTEAGKELQREIGLAHARDVADAMSALTPEELASLALLARKLTSQED
jgi:DNA-binding MarR family transcriptional regulator